MQSGVPSPSLSTSRTPQPHTPGCVLFGSSGQQSPDASPPSMMHGKTTSAVLDSGAASARMPPVPTEASDPAAPPVAAPPPVPALPPRASATDVPPVPTTPPVPAAPP